MRECSLSVCTIMKSTILSTLLATGTLAFAQETQTLPELNIVTGSNAANPSSIALMKHSQPHVAQAATAVPGISAVSRGCYAVEPVIRGLGWERVSTQLDGLPLYAACPARMDPPGLYLAPTALESLHIETSLPSVTGGPAANGGRINGSTELALSGDKGLTGASILTVNRADDSWNFTNSFRKEEKNLAVKVFGDATERGDTESADGTKVPSSAEAVGGGASFALQANDRLKIWGTAQRREESDTEYPALPMDMVYADSDTVSVGLRYLPTSGSWTSIESTLTGAWIDHRMSNANKPNRGMLEATTDSESDSLGGRILAKRTLAEASTITLGVDGHIAKRDALRERLMKRTGMRFEDRLWPDVKQEQAGLFLETTHQLRDDLSLRTGVRGDLVSTEAQAMTDRQRMQFASFNGNDADNGSSDHETLSGNLVLEGTLSDRVSWDAGIGRSVRAPGMTELYFSFAPAPGGFQLGNPGLDPEVKHEIDLGLTLQNEHHFLRLSVFAAHVEDYILQTRIGQRDVNGDGSPDNIRGFRNTDAEFFGGELEGESNMGALVFRGDVAYVQGRNTDEGRDLPEIPPLGGNLSLELPATEGRSWSVETGMRFALRQDRIDQTFPEDETAGFVVFHLAGGIQVTDRIHLKVGVENLFDREYNEHLTREAFLPVGDLAAGDEIPNAGRSGYARVSIDW